MITLSDHADTPDLDAETIQSLFKLLAIDNPPDCTDFLAHALDDPTFHAFFFNVLIENQLPCALSVDWKWEPEDLFAQFNRSLDIADKLRYGHTEAGMAQYDISYEYRGTIQHIRNIFFEEPGELIAQLAQYLQDKDIVAIDFREDSYSWLIVPKDFDVEQFRKITGLLAEGEPIPEPPPAVTEDFVEGRKQSEKIFFTPRIIFVEQNGTGYSMPNQFWSGRVLAGQTIREGIATELQQEMHYSGRFDYVYDGYIGIRQDRKGRDIKSYWIKVFLYDRTFESGMAGGADIQLKKISGQKFPYPENV